MGVSSVTWRVEMSLHGLLLLLIIITAITAGCSKDGTTTITSTTAPTTGSDDTDDPVTITGGDLLLVRERNGSGADDSFEGGAIIAFSKDGEYKGVIKERDADSDILRYVRGMRLEKDPLDSSVYYLSVGTTTDGSNMEVHRFPDQITSTGTTTLGTPVQITGTDTVAASTYIFGMTGHYGARRYISESASSSVHFYYNGGDKDSCGITVDPAWTIGALYGTQAGVAIVSHKYSDGEI
jgi:hypothetical protein